MKLLYFAWIRTRIGRSGENLPLPAEVETVGDLITYLRARGGGYEDALAEPEVIKVAVNQEFSDFTHRLADDDEVALFPPVTGG